MAASNLVRVGSRGSALALRQNFADVAYWRAAAETGANGQVTFSVSADGTKVVKFTARNVEDILESFQQNAEAELQ